MASTWNDDLEDEYQRFRTQKFQQKWEEETRKTTVESNSAPSLVVACTPDQLYPSGRGFFFQVVYTPGRDGSEQDIAKIKALMDKLDVLPEDQDMAIDLSKPELENKIVHVQQKLANVSYDYFVIFIQAHGNSKNGKDYIEIPLHPQTQLDATPIIDPNTEADFHFYLCNLFEPFTNTVNFSALDGKPRIAIVQACRGSGGNQFDGTTPVDITSTSRFVPNVADFAVISAAVEDTGAIRQPSQGSKFIQTFCKVVSENMSMLLIDIFHKVASRLKSREPVPVSGPTEWVYPVPCFCHYSLDKHFRFKPQ